MENWARGHIREAPALIETSREKVRDLGLLKAGRGSSLDLCSGLCSCVCV